MSPCIQKMIGQGLVDDHKMRESKDLNCSGLFDGIEYFVWQNLKNLKSQ